MNMHVKKHSTFEIWPLSEHFVPENIVNPQKKKKKKKKKKNKQTKKKTPKKPNKQTNKKNNNKTTTTTTTKNIVPTHPLLNPLLSFSRTALHRAK